MRNIARAGTTNARSGDHETTPIRGRAMNSDDIDIKGPAIAMRLRHAGSSEPRYLRLDEPSGPKGREPDEQRPRQAGRAEEFFLRAANLMVAVVALLILSPAILIISLLISLDSPGPIIYRQLRVGLDRRGRADDRDRTGRRVSDLGGRPFMIYKFRTMPVDAELDSGPVWASRDDRRATRIGRWLRKTRLDEIPQFWNVLKGDMAVVGPRPERPNFVLDLQKEIDGYRMRNRVKPGITGWAQINKAADQSVEDVREKVGYDLEYVRRRSLWFDVLIMLRTLPVMLEREKTYETDQQSRS